MTIRTSISAGALISTIVATIVAHATETTRYVLMAGDGKRAGEQIVERSDSGLATVRYIFKDNGRGPELTERIQVLPDGTFSTYEVQGKSTFGASVNERFARSGDKAEWQSTSERGSSAVAGSALYVPLNSSFEVASMSIGALAARADGKLPLLPSGTLTQRVLEEVDLTDAAGQRRRVQLLAQTGLGLSPALYWATTESRPRLYTLPTMRSRFPRACNMQSATSRTWTKLRLNSFSKSTR